MTGNVYFRHLSTATSSSDINEAALSESVYQPSAAERAALATAGYGGYPDSGASAANTPFPRWRCIATALLNDDPNGLCNGLINRTRTRQHNAGFALQAALNAVAAGLAQQLLIGVALDASRVQFGQTTQFGFINPDRSIAPVSGPGAFADGSQDSQHAFDARVSLGSRSQTASLYASDTLALNPQTHLTLAGRYNRNSVRNSDAITPGGGTGSLDGRYTFAHFNPAVGITFAPSKAVTVYSGINQGTRAPTAVELGCADPASPCKLPNAFAGDPPLKQVRTTSVEAGARGVAGGLAWNLALFRADNRADLLFVSDNVGGYGYFKNFGRTRRQGLEAGLSLKPSANWTLVANLSLLDATYRSAEVVDGGSNSSNDAATVGFPGVEGMITIRPGDRIPLLPRGQLKLFADWEPSARWQLGADLNAFSGANARGNENGQHRSDGGVYRGPGRSAGYVVMNLNIDYRPMARLKVFVNLMNLFDRRYSSAAQLGTNGFDAGGNFLARPLPRDANGDYPLPRSTFFAPGAPRAAFVGLSYAFAADNN